MRVEACAATIGTQVIDGSLVSLELPCETIVSHPAFEVVTYDVAHDCCVASAISAKRQVTFNMPLHAPVRDRDSEAGCCAH
jgi:hypothetical protein